MEKQLKKNNSTTCHKVWAWNDTLSEHDLLAYIDGRLSLEDTTKIEAILFAKDNDFYLDILENLKERYLQHQGSIQAVLDELDKEAEQIPFFQTQTPITEKPKKRKSNKHIQQQLDEIYKSEDAQNRFSKEKSDSEAVPNFIEHRAFEKRVLGSDSVFFVQLPSSALTKLLGGWMP